MRKKTAMGGGISYHGGSSSSSSNRNSRASTPTGSPNGKKVKPPPFVPPMDGSVEAPAQFTHTHLMLRSHKGQEAVKAYIMAQHGISQLINCTDAWTYIQEWKKLPTTSKEFEKKALNIFELFVLEDGARATRIQFEGKQKLLDKILIFKLKDHTGFFKPATMRRGSVRQMLHIPARTYSRWTEEAIIAPEIFEDLEWACFQHIYQALEDDPKFWSSVEFQAYLAWHKNEQDIRDRRQHEDYGVYRKGLVDRWVHDFKGHETAMLAKAGEVVEEFMTREIEEFFMDRYTTLSRMCVP